MKVILIGKGPGWEKAPVGGENWGLNDLVIYRPLTLTFEMHDIDKFRTKTNSAYVGLCDAFEREIDTINKLGIPVITQKKHKILPTAIPFPLDEMPIKYFTSSIAYMVAYAIYKGATELEMYGCPLLGKDEYSEQRQCIEFWIGYAMGKGIKVTVHKPTNILTAKPRMGLYGYEWDNWGNIV
jgi:hypothetical protein